MGRGEYNNEIVIGRGGGGHGGGHGGHGHGGRRGGRGRRGRGGRGFWGGGWGGWGGWPYYGYGYDYPYAPLAYVAPSGYAQAPRHVYHLMGAEHDHRSAPITHPHPSAPVYAHPSAPVYAHPPRSPMQPPAAHQRHHDYVYVENYGWWPQWYPYWDPYWYAYWPWLYDYYGGDDNAEYAEYARDVALRAMAPQWGWTL